MAEARGGNSSVLGLGHRGPAQDPGGTTSEASEEGLRTRGVCCSETPQERMLPTKLGVGGLCGAGMKDL